MKEGKATDLRNKREVFAQKRGSESRFCFVLREWGPVTNSTSTGCSFNHWHGACPVFMICVGVERAKAVWYSLK